MNRNGAKSKSRGEILAKKATTTVKGSQDNDAEQNTSPLRNQSSRWKAHTMDTTTSPSTSPARQEKSHKKAKPLTKYPAVTKDGSVPQSKEHASATKASSSSPNPLGFIRSASSSSAQKQPNNTQKSGDLRRSMSDNSAPKNHQRSPANAEIASPADTDDENDKCARRAGKTSHKTPKDKGSPVRTADTCSSHKKPADTDDENDKSARRAGNTSHKTPKDKGSPVRTTDTRSSHKKRKSLQLDSDSNSDGAPNKRSARKKHKSQQLESDSNSDDDFENSSVPSPKSQNGSARKVQKHKRLDLDSSDASIGNINCYVAPKHCKYVSCFVFTNLPITNIKGSMLNAHTRKAINELIPAGNAIFLYICEDEITLISIMQHHIYLEGTRQRPFMYWANKPDEDCIERLFRYYDNTIKLARFYTEDFVEKWATKVRAIANAEK